jgi:hypothetical protein
MLEAGRQETEFGSTFKIFLMNRTPIYIAKHYLAGKGSNSWCKYMN